MRAAIANLPLLLPLVSMMLLLPCSGCGNGAKHRAPDEYTGCGADEQFTLLEDAEPTGTIDDTQAPQMTQPTNGAMVPGSVKPVVQWNQNSTNPGQPDGDVPYMNGVNGCNDCCPQFSMGALMTLHEPPISGDVYDVHITADGSYVWRLVTTLQEWTPTDDLWPKLQGHTVSLQIWRMSLLQNNPKAGPFVATQPFTFTVGAP